LHGECHGGHSLEGVRRIRLARFSPDGGDGSTEALIVIACTVALATLIVAFSPKLRGYLRQLFTRGVLGS